MEGLNKKDLEMGPQREGLKAGKQWKGKLSRGKARKLSVGMTKWEERDDPEAYLASHDPEWQDEMLTVLTGSVNWLIPS